MSSSSSSSSSSSPLSSPPVVMDQANALESFYQAMESIQEADKKEYMAAMQTCPHLVATESDPMQFLRYTDFDSWAAAKRLCCFWKERCELFQERAFLPMTIDGRGAMNDQDILVLQAGFPAMLPKTNNGRQVAFLDRGKWLPGTDRINRCRACFYMAIILAKDPKAQETDGVLYLNSLIQPRLEPFDIDFSKKQLHLSKHAYAVKVEPHCFCVLPRTITERMGGRYAQRQQGTNQNKLSFCEEIISFFYGPHGSHFKTNVHFQINPGDMHKVLMELSCNTEGIPSCYDGSWTFDHAREWFRQQVALESMSHLNPGPRAVNSLVTGGEGHGATAHSTTGAIGSNNTNNSRSINSQPRRWTTDRMRAVNAIHSRRKREKRKKEMESMKEECEKLQAANKVLKHENEQLQSALATVQHLAATLDTAKNGDGVPAEQTSPQEEPKSQMEL